MSLTISGSMVMADLLNFDSKLSREAVKVDLGADSENKSILVNIGNERMVYTLDGRKVEVHVDHADVVLTFYLGTQKIFVSSLKNSSVDQQVNAALNWLTGNPVSSEPMPQKDLRVQSPEDGKDYSTVELVVQISSSYESMCLYREYTALGLTYKQDMGGPLKRIHCGGRNEVYVSPLIHVVDGVRVLYIEPTSAVIDWFAIEEWVKRRVPEGTLMLNDAGRAVGEIRSIARSKAGEIAA